MPVSADSRIGTELAGYRIEVLIGRGGMGVVYRARDLALDRDVALKLLAPHLADDVSFRERFLKESRVAASLEHPNVVPIHDAGEIDGQLYIVMRLVEGSDLKKVLSEGPLEPRHAISILEQIAGALDAAHARGLVHRDVKPSNVLLDEREHVYLADFGLSRYLGDAALPLGPAKSLGTADYVAPEQIRGEEVDGRADVYALGCMLYECLAGEPPFRRGTDAATLYAQLEEAPPVLPGLEEVLPKALAKEPAERYADLRRADRRGPRSARASPSRSAAAGRLPSPLSASPLIAAALLAFFLTRGDGAAAGRARRRLARPHRPDDERGLARRFPSAARRAAVAVDDGHVWVTSFGDGNVWRIDPKSKDVVRRPDARKSDRCRGRAAVECWSRTAPNRARLARRGWGRELRHPLGGPRTTSARCGTAGDGASGSPIRRGSRGQGPARSSSRATTHADSRPARPDEPHRRVRVVRRLRVRRRGDLGGRRHARPRALAHRPGHEQGRREDSAAVRPGCGRRRRGSGLGDLPARRHGRAHRPRHEPDRAADPRRAGRERASRRATALSGSRTRSTAPSPGSTRQRAR